MASIKVLVNDGIHPSGKEKLEAHGFELCMDRVDQEQLAEELPKYDAILVRSATKVRAELIDACPNLKLIGRGGVGLDNIDVGHAASQGIKVINTPAASSQSVAELVLAHLFSLSRMLHSAHRDMPNSGHTDFKKHKKTYSKGFELSGKTLGIVGFGRIGQALASMALGLGMKVLPVSRKIEPFSIPLHINPAYPDAQFNIDLESVHLQDMLAESDFVSLHVPKQKEPLFNYEQLKKMKKGAIIVNTSRGGLIDEGALIKILDEGHLGGAALDVFDNEPQPKPELLAHPSISSTPHIGGSTQEGQRNIGLELADQMIEFFKA